MLLAVRVVAYSSFGQRNVVAILLQDKRVDPAANDNEAIRLAGSAGRARVVAILIRDAGGSYIHSSNKQTMDTIISPVLCPI